MEGSAVLPKTYLKKRKKNELNGFSAISIHEVRTFFVYRAFFVENAPEKIKDEYQFRSLKPPKILSFNKFYSHCAFCLKMLRTRLIQK